MRLICSEYRIVAIFWILELNRDNMGTKEKSIMTGVVIEVAIICVLLRMPMIAPVSKEVRMPVDIMVIKVMLV